MKNDVVKYEDLSLIGMELFRKNNDTFMRSNLSPIMSRIFKAANHKSKINNTDNEYYMKSGILPNKVFYIYSDQLAEKNPTKLFDVVDFNGESCIWFYSINVINSIESDPLKYITEIYKVLVSLHHNIDDTFKSREGELVTFIMTIALIKFLYETYGVLNLKEYKNKIAKRLNNFTKESAMYFIEDVLEKCDEPKYYSSREYLDSYLLLELINE